MAVKCANEWFTRPELHFNFLTKCFAGNTQVEKVLDRFVTKALI